LPNWNCGKACDQVNIFEAKSIVNPVRRTHAIVGINYENSEIVVAFRGTNGMDYENWCTNINAFQSDYNSISGAKVHTGFLQAYKDVREKVIHQVTEYIRLPSKMKIFVTGHSLGGALALLAALDIKLTFNKEVTLYTYG
jgi:predicted lipase